MPRPYTGPAVAIAEQSQARVGTVRQGTSRISQIVTLVAVLVPPLGILLAMGLLWGIAFHWVDVAVLFVLFHQRLCGPLAHSLFRHQPHGTHLPNAQLEVAFHKADDSIRQIIELLDAA